MKIRPPIKQHGGKFPICHKIVPLLPPHEAYVEPFSGGASVLLNKPRSSDETLNDIDPDLANLWKTMRDYSGDLLELLQGMDYNERTFERVGHYSTLSFGVVRSAYFLARKRMSRGGMGKTFAWSERKRGGRPGDENAWHTFLEKHYPAIVERIRGVSIECADAVRLMPRLDSPSTTFYCDPPYVPETRTAPRVYDNEMSVVDHERFLECALSMKGAVVISGYRCPLYDEALEGWTQHEFDVPNHSGQGKTKQRRTECLWIKSASK